MSLRRVVTFIYTQIHIDIYMYIYTECQSQKNITCLLNWHDHGIVWKSSYPLFSTVFYLLVSVVDFINLVRETSNANRSFQGHLRGSTSPLTSSSIIRLLSSPKTIGLQDRVYPSQYPVLDSKCEDSSNLSRSFLCFPYGYLSGLKCLIPVSKGVLKVF